MDFSDPETARRILERYRTFAVVGCSNDPARASLRVARYLVGHGYEVIPVNPQEASCGGMGCYPTLADAAAEHDIEVVDIFRQSRFVSGHVNEAIAIGATAVWMQLGVIDEDAARRAVEAGLDVVMDRCPAIDHPRFFAA